MIFNLIYFREPTSSYLNKSKQTFEISVKTGQFLGHRRSEKFHPDCVTQTTKNTPGK